MLTVLWPSDISQSIETPVATQPFPPPPTTGNTDINTKHQYPQGYFHPLLELRVDITQAVEPVGYQL